MFADQVLQLSYRLPTSFLYGLGEHRDALTHSLNWTRFTLWNKDKPPTVRRLGYLVVYLLFFVYSGIIPSQNPLYGYLFTWLFICCFLCIQASYLVRTHCMVTWSLGYLFVVFCASYLVRTYSTAPCLLGYLFVVFCVFRHHT